MLLYASPVQMMPPRDQTGVPLHFDDLGVCGEYDFAEFRERLPAPAGKFPDLRVDQCRGGFRRGERFHVFG
jgi:hypothetical protein